MSGWPIQYARMAKYCSTWRNYADVQCNAMSKYNHFSCWESVSGIRDYWAGTIGHTFGDYERFLDVAGPGHWNDVRPKRSSSLLCSACTSSQSDDAFVVAVVAQADMLVIGNADHPFGGTPSSPACIGGAVGTTLSCGKLTLEEEETQMGLWAMFASPMMMSVRFLNSEIYSCVVASLSRSCCCLQNDPRLVSNASRAILLNPGEHVCLQRL